MEDQETVIKRTWGKVFAKSVGIQFLTLIELHVCNFSYNTILKENVYKYRNHKDIFSK